MPSLIKGSYMANQDEFYKNLIDNMYDGCVFL